MISHVMRIWGRELNPPLGTEIGKISPHRDPQWFGWMPPRILIYCTILAWVSFGTLGLYILRLGWKSIKVVFGPLSSAPEPA